jgi:hypothetical protein
MNDPLVCPEPDCMVKVKLVNGSRENDFCKFQEAECPQCNQLYWLVKYDGKRTLRIREKDDDVEFFDQYFIASMAA